eukprot:RCo037675
MTLQTYMENAKNKINVKRRTPVLPCPPKSCANCSDPLPLTLSADVSRMPAVIRSRPDSFPALVPAALQQLVRRCEGDPSAPLLPNPPTVEVTLHSLRTHRLSCGRSFRLKILREGSSDGGQCKSAVVDELQKLCDGSSAPCTFAWTKALHHSSHCAAEGRANFTVRVDCTPNKT